MKVIDIYEEVKAAKTIGISGHIRPDGDCVGSCLGLYLYLKKKCSGARVQVMLEKPGDIFSCISGFDEIDSTFSGQQEPYDVFIALDCEKAGWVKQRNFLIRQERGSISIIISAMKMAVGM